FVLIGKARTLATVFAFEPQGQTLAGIPVEAGVEHMLRRVGQRSALVDTALLFAVAIGVVAAQAPARCKLPAAGQFQTLGNGFVDVDALCKVFLSEAAAKADATGLVRVGCVKTVGQWRAVVDLVFELVVEQGGVGIEASIVVVVHAEFGVSGDFWIKIRAANSDGAALATYTVDTVMQLVKGGCLVASADTTFHSPAVAGVPHQVGAWAYMATEGIMVFVASAEGQRQIVAQSPLILEEQRPGGLLEF